jgi:hypothetical protein
MFDLVPAYLRHQIDWKPGEEKPFDAGEIGDATVETAPGFQSRCEQLISTLNIPQPFDMYAFLTSLAEQRGRRIELVPATLPATLPCGMLVCTDDVDYIFHAIDTTPLHAWHIDMHEVGHLLLDHAAILGRHGLDENLPALDEQTAVRLLLPDLSPELIRRILGRTGYSDAHEREAEVFASMLLSATNPGVPEARSEDFTEHLSRLRVPAEPPAAGAQWVA